MTKPTKEVSLKEIYLEYYNFVAQTHPYGRVVGGYDTAISSIIRVLPSEFRLHIEGVEIVSCKTAKQLWDKAIAEVKHDPALSGEDRRADTDYPGFFRKKEFVPPLTVGNLCKVIAADYGNVPIQTPVNTIAWLKKLLEIPNLYDILYAKIPDNIFARSKENAIAKGRTIYYEAESYRDRAFADLNNDEQVKLKQFNRFALERFYPQDVPQTPDVYLRDSKRQWEIKLKKVELYLTGEHVKHLEELTPGTLAGATVNTPQNAASKPPEEQSNFNWDVEVDKVFSNKTEVVSLTRLQLKLFLALYKNKGEFVSRETLEACWDTKPEYGSFVTDAMSRLEGSLKKSLDFNKSIFAKQLDGKKIVSYKLPL